jgi:Family of unknown function (DUF6504)
VRRYDDPVEVRSGWVEGPGHRGPVDRMEGPEQFLWRGRLWKVRAVLAHWIETGPWWQSSGVRAVIGSDDPDPRGAAPAGGRSATAELLVERELWRVEAGHGAAGRGPDDSSDDRSDDWGVFDLSFDWTEGSWQLVGCVD